MNKLSLVNTAIFAVLLLPCLARAGSGMDDEQMRQMMKNAQKMQECMADIDPAVFSRIEAKSKEMQAKVKALCDAGKRNQASQASITYGRELSASSEMKALRKCGVLAQGMLQDIPGVKQQLETAGEQHVCDNPE